MGVVNFKKSLLAISIVTILSACGGGSSGDETAGTTGGTALNASISGVAAKGIIIGGNVVASELNADKTVKNANVGSATTDSNGAYSLDLNDTYEGGPIEIKVTTSASTLVVCDVSNGCGTRTDDVTDTDTVIDFGEQYKPGADNLSMTALLPDAEDGETISVQITPFTHMAAVQALSGATVDTAAINDANSSVSALLGGLDILTLEPVDITNLMGDEDATAVTYAALSASIAELAPTNADGQPDINAAIDNLASSFSGGAIEVEDSDDSDDVIALQEILDQTNAVLTEAGATDTTGVIAGIQDDVDTVVAGNGGSTITPEANANAGDSDVAKARSFVVDLRTWGTTIQGELEAPSAAFDAQLSLSDDASYMVQSDSSEVIAYGAMAIAQFFEGSITALSGFTANDGSGISFSAGTLSKSANDYTLSGGLATIKGVEYSLTMTLQAPADQSSSNVITFAVKNLTAEDDSSKLEAANGSIAVTLVSTYTIDYSALDLGTAVAFPDPEKIELNLEATYTQKQTLSAGNLVTATDPVSFATNLSMTLFTYVENGEVIDVLPGSFSASGTVSNASNSFDVSISASIPNASTVVDNPAKSLATGSSYAANNAGNSLVSWSVGANVFTYTHPYNSFSATIDALGVVTVNQYGFDNVFPNTYGSLDQFLASQSYLLNDYLYYFYMDGQGEYSRTVAVSLAPDYSTDGSVAFSLDYPDVEFFDADQPLLATIGVQFTVQLNGLAEANVSVTGASTDFEKGNADVSISYGTRKLQFVASNDNAAPNEEAASIEITNQDNVKLLLTPKGLNGVISDEADVTINGKVIATIKEVNGFTRVEYIDGTFESL